MISSSSPLQRDDILDAAVRVGGLEGDSAINRSRVVAELGISDVSVFFDSDESLVESIEPYLKRRKARFITETFQSTLRMDTPIEKYIALADSYMAYVLHEPDLYHYIFEVHGGLTSQQMELAHSGKDVANQSISVLLGVLRDMATEVGADVSDDEIFHAGMASWAAAHGSAHLSMVGVLRLQHAVVRRYNFDTIIKDFAHAVVERFKLGKKHSSPDIYAQLRPVIEDYTAGLPDYSSVTVTADMDDELLRTVALETALTIVGVDGLDALSIERLTQRLGLPQDRVLQAVDSLYNLREDAEVITDREVADFFVELLGALPADATAIDRLRAMAVAYFHYAVNDPARFNAMIALGSKSVVPSSVEGHENEMGTAFKAVQDLCRDAIIESGGDSSDQQVYIKTLTLWAGADGISHLCSVADLRDLTLDEKWKLMEVAIEYVIASFENELKS